MDNNTPDFFDAVDAAHTQEKEEVAVQNPEEHDCVFNERGYCHELCEIQQYWEHQKRAHEELMAWVTKPE